LKFDLSHQQQQQQQQQKEKKNTSAPRPHSFRNEGNEWHTTVSISPPFPSNRTTVKNFFLKKEEDGFIHMRAVIVFVLL
jgi:hypothetical protein